MLLPDTLDIHGAFPPLSRRLRLGVVGGGRIAKTQAMAARMSDYWHIVAGAFSADPARTEAAASQWRVAADRSYQSFAQMAQAESQRADGIDAVMITTPNHLHFESAQAFLDAGIHILCDKPLVNEVAQADALVDTLVTQARQKPVFFGVSYVMCCFPMVRQAREIVAQGTLGTINQMHMEFMQDWMMPQDIAEQGTHVKWRLDPQKSGKTSCVGDIGTHAAHLSSFVSGLAMTHIKSEFHICGHPNALEDTFFAWTRHNGTVPGTLMATRFACGNRGGLRLRVFGDRGGIEWDLEHCDRLKLHRFGHPDQVLSRGHGHGVSPQVERFVRSGRGFPEGIIEAWANLYTECAMAVACKIDGRDIPKNWLHIPDVTDGATGVRFIDACVRSNAQHGIWVSL